MTESEYLARLAMRCNDWRQRFPSRADELRPVMRRHLGISLRQSQEIDFARQSLEQAENEIIRVANGWPSMASCVTEPEPPRPSAPIPPPKDFQPTGRDLAAGDA